MSKEQQELLDEVYGRYWNSIETSEYDGFGPTLIKFPTLMKEQFVERIKTDDKFSEKWGLKIEEKELSTQERNEWFQIHLNGNNPLIKSDWKDFELDQQNIPTKQITLEYNNEKTYYYE
jgi:hypothetical protein